MTDPRLPNSVTQAALLPSPLARPRQRPVTEAPFPAPEAPSRAIVPAVVPGGYALWELPVPLRRLFTRLDASTDAAVPLEMLEAELGELETGLQMFAPWWIFDAAKYRRNLIRRTAAYEALLLCWLPGQRSPIHDHAASGCAFRVVEGVVTETRYEPTWGDLATPVAMRWLPVGTTSASRDADIHEVANTERSADLVTLHIYSPPLREPKLYRSADPKTAS